MSKRDLVVMGSNINVKATNGGDYISLTDMEKKFPEKVRALNNWIRATHTIEFIQEWREINPRNSNWAENAQLESGHGLIERRGRYGGTWAHKDIAYNFAMWLSPKFQLHLIKDYERLKAQEVLTPEQIEWSRERRDSIWHFKEMNACLQIRLRLEEIPEESHYKFYQREADMLNIHVFNKTAREAGCNQRLGATALQLMILNSLESLNASNISDGMSFEDRRAACSRRAISLGGNMIKNPVLLRLTGY